MAVVCTLLSACASWPGDIVPGTSVTALQSRFGTPAGSRQVADGSVLVYSTAPFGQYAWAAHIGRDQRVDRVEQVLTRANFARIEFGNWTTDTVRAWFGAPAEVRQFRADQTWWSYRYKEDGVWNSLMNIRFDDRGIARETINMPDPWYEDKPNRE